MAAVPITTIEQDGFLIDPETGEIVGVVTPKAEFQIDSSEAAEWVLEKWQGLEADLAAIDAREKAILENMGAMKRNVQQRIKSLEFRFKDELAHYASQNLPKGKKTWSCPYGQVSFRTTGPKLGVANNELAIGWAKFECPAAVKVTESFLVSMVPDEQKEKFLASPTDAAVCGFDVIPGGESVTVKTGVS